MKRAIRSKEIVQIGDVVFSGKRANLAALVAIFVNNPYQSPRINSSGS